MTMSEFFYFLFIGFILYKVVKDWNKPSDGNYGPPWVRNNRNR